MTTFEPHAPHSSWFNRYARTRYLVSASLSLSALGLPLLLPVMDDAYVPSAILVALGILVRPTSPTTMARYSRSPGMILFDGVYALACMASIYVVYQALGIVALRQVMEDRRVWASWLVCGALAFTRGYIAQSAVIASASEAIPNEQRS